MDLSKRISIAAAMVFILAFLIQAGDLSQRPASSLFSCSSALAAGEAEYIEDGYDVVEPFGSQPETVPDPLEKSNRAVFQFNDRLYFWVLKPTATVYSAYLPPGVRTCFRNLFYNLQFPIRVVNNALQGKAEGAGIELARFGINATMGLGGLFDVASTNFNIAPRDEDFGLTLGHYGMPNGVYLVLPFFGPSSLRDTAGRVADGFLDPAYYIPWFWVATGTKVGTLFNQVSLRVGKYEDLKKSAVDPYASMRNAYIKYRADQIKEQ